MKSLTQVSEPENYAEYVFGHGPTLDVLNHTLAEVASTDIPILILGESGTGKDTYARLIHRRSSSADGEFRKLCCSMLQPEQLLEHLQSSSRVNSLTQPAGTWFLDGIDDLDQSCQRVLLSALPDSQGQIANGQCCARLISSSCANLEAAVEAGSLRKELYFRINGICLKLPPLRERKEDIGTFLDHFLGKYSQKLKRPAPSLDQETLDALMAYDWPGNIRQLENLVRKIVVLGDAHLAVQEIRSASLIVAPADTVRSASSLKVAAKAASKKAECQLILQALERTRWNRKKAARDLQISYKSLLYKIKQFGVPTGKHEG
jgi:two-component system response regulator AtoC